MRLSLQGYERVVAMETGPILHGILSYLGSCTVPPQKDPACGDLLDTDLVPGSQPEHEYLACAPR
jgi:hypothetical protein